MIYMVDIDDTICHTPNVDGVNRYDLSTPIPERIAIVNKLYTDGHIIKYWTARGTSTGKDWYEYTKEQLASWGCKYHEFNVGKPSYDIWIDDKALNCDDYFTVMELIS